MIHSVKVCAVLPLAAAALPAPVAPNVSSPIPRQDALYQMPHNARSTFTRIRPRITGSSVAGPLPRER